MPDAFLVFQLYGPLAAWGDVAIGSVRPAADRPSRSGVLGLVAAGLGIPRTDAPRRAAVAASLGVGVRVDAAGVPLVDYHTAQVAAGPAARRAPTRREELDSGPLRTVLSSRTYRADARATVVLWVRPGASHTLAEVADALRTPRFPLALGRRSCPPTLPLDPRLVDAASVPEALTAYDALRPAPETTSGRRDPLAPALTFPRQPIEDSAPTARLYLDAEGATGLTIVQSNTRRDEPNPSGFLGHLDRVEILVQVPAAL